MKHAQTAAECWEAIKAHSLATSTPAPSPKEQKPPKDTHHHRKRNKRKRLSRQKGKLAFAAKLRRSMTPAELRLWQFLRHGVAGRACLAQEIVCGYIVDFYFPDARLAVEVDGRHHDEEHQRRYDATRTMHLDKDGNRVIRFTNETVFRSVEPILNKIERIVRERCAEVPWKRLKRHHRRRKFNPRRQGGNRRGRE